MGTLRKVVGGRSKCFLECYRVRSTDSRDLSVGLKALCLRLDQQSPELPISRRLRHMFLLPFGGIGVSKRGLQREEDCGCHNPEQPLSALLAGDFCAFSRNQNVFNYSFKWLSPSNSQCNSRILWSCQDPILTTWCGSHSWLQQEQEMTAGFFPRHLFSLLRFKYLSKVKSRVTSKTQSCEEI